MIWTTKFVKILEDLLKRYVDEMRGEADISLKYLDADKMRGKVHNTKRATSNGPYLQSNGGDDNGGVDDSNSP